MYKKYSIKRSKLTAVYICYAMMMYCGLCCLVSTMKVIKVLSMYVCKLFMKTATLHEYCIEKKLYNLKKKTLEKH